jgi:hypothetical protein
MLRAGESRRAERAYSDIHVRNSTRPPRADKCPGINKIQPSTRSTQSVLRSTRVLFLFHLSQTYVSYFYIGCACLKL